MRNERGGDGKIVKLVNWKEQRKRERNETKFRSVFLQTLTGERGKFRTD